MWFAHARYLIGTPKGAIHGRLQLYCALRDGRFVALPTTAVGAAPLPIAAQIPSYLADQTTAESGRPRGDCLDGWAGGRDRRGWGLRRIMLAQGADTNIVAHFRSGSLLVTLSDANMSRVIPLFAILLQKDAMSQHQGYIALRFRRSCGDRIGWIESNEETHNYTGGKPHVA